MRRPRFAAGTATRATALLRFWKREGQLIGTHQSLSLRLIALFGVGASVESSRLALSSLVLVVFCGVPLPMFELGGVPPLPSLSLVVTSLVDCVDVGDEGRHFWWDPVK